MKTNSNIMEIDSGSPIWLTGKVYNNSPSFWTENRPLCQLKKSRDFGLFVLVFTSQVNQWEQRKKKKKAQKSVTGYDKLVVRLG